MLQDDKVRRRSEWMKWVPIASRVATDSGLPSSGGSSQDLLTAAFQKIVVEEGTLNQGSTTGRSQLPNGEGTEDI